MTKIKKVDLTKETMDNKKNNILTNEEITFIKKYWKALENRQNALMQLKEYENKAVMNKFHNYGMIFCAWGNMPEEYMTEEELMEYKKLEEKEKETFKEMYQLEFCDMCKNLRRKKVDFYLYK